MSSYDLMLRNGIVVTADAELQADVGVVGDMITTVAPRLAGDARQTIDADGCYILPGFVDPHVHLSLPNGQGLTSSDDFESGTIAAACGGTTTIIDFTTQRRGISLSQAVAERRAQADGRAVIDYALHLTVTDANPQTLADLRTLAQHGYPSLKLYMTYESVMVRDDDILRILDVAADCGVLALVHAEHHDIVTYLQHKLIADGHRDPGAHALSRPTWVEAEAVGRAIALARATGAPLYIVHVSCAEAVGHIRRARGDGQAVYAETCPHYLLLSDEEYSRPGFEAAKYVMTPPLRPSGNQSALWDALTDGTLDVVATDHCPWMYATQKIVGRDDFRRIPGGIAGVETRGVLLYSEGVVKRQLSLRRLVALLSTNPARLFGLYPRKGTIAAGSDADIVIFDSRRSWTISNRLLHQHVDYTVFEGWPVVGYPLLTVSRGQIVARDGQFVGRRGHGQFIARQR